jgi:hypothetical protein
MENPGEMSPKKYSIDTYPFLFSKMFAKHC